MNYEEFIAKKTKVVAPAGFEPKPIKGSLFEWQKHVVRWAIRQGRAALFEECGLGKTIQQIEWADQVSDHTNGPVLILTPLAVAHQTEKEAERFGYKASVVSSQDQVGQTGIYITNYEKLDNFTPESFSGVVLDESSCLKNFTGKMRQQLTNQFANTPYKLCCTATPSPNDYTEIGQHAAFLNVCSREQMLATFFINDTFNTGDWRLKKHAASEFWKWLASWACCISKPSDIGFDDEGYILPQMHIKTEVVEADISQHSGDDLFRIATLSATSMHKEMRLTSQARSERAASIVSTRPNEPWIIWCNTNDEADKLKAAIPESIEVRGSDNPAQKEKKLDSFTNGESRIIISKPSVAGYGLNWQHCSNVVFVGLSYSFEDFYQALRRSYRFGQKKEVNAYIVQADTEGAILRVIERKIKQHKAMQEEMKNASAIFARDRIKELTANTEVKFKEGLDWKLYHGDCVRVARSIPDQSVDFSVFSPPFADLFTYSDDLQDMGNCATMDEFMEHFQFLIQEMRRIMVPGREVAVHCVDLLATKWKHGFIGFQDFSGLIIRAFWECGFILHSRVTIWKSPVTEMQRTKAHGLLYKTLCSDSSSCRVGAPDYLLVFRNPGESLKPVKKDKSEYPVDWWQEVASPVWMTVDQGRVLNGECAREQEDERHICPLQLDVIERAIELWTNKGDLVYSPFAGIGSEGHQALKMDRRFIGSELKESYFEQACKNLDNAKSQMELNL